MTRSFLGLGKFCEDKVYQTVISNWEFEKTKIGALGYELTNYILVQLWLNTHAAGKVVFDVVVIVPQRKHG